MACAVRAGEVRAGRREFNPMPQLGAARDVYEDQYPDRLQSFPPNEETSCKKTESSRLEPYQHQLRYDAESVFWLFLWWSLQIRPAESESEELVSEEHWGNFISKMDMRDRVFISRGIPKNLLHTEYQPLEELLKQMADQLTGDHSLEPSRAHPEYLHEAFQRLILEFLVANYSQRFMKLRTHNEFRKVKGDTATSQWSSYTSTGKRKRDERDDGAQVSSIRDMVDQVLRL